MIKFTTHELEMENTNAVEKENDIILNINNNIENMIYEIRGVQVMFSSDVAKLYQVETRGMN